MLLLSDDTVNKSNILSEDFNLKLKIPKYGQLIWRAWTDTIHEVSDNQE